MKKKEIKRCRDCGEEVYKGGKCYDCFKKYKSETDRKYREKNREKLNQKKKEYYYSAGKEYICKNCAKKFKRPIKRMFCCNSCQAEFWKKQDVRVYDKNPNWKNGNHYKTIWKRYMKFLEKNGYDIKKYGCEICHRTNKLRYDLHHIIYKSEIPQHKELHNPLNIIFVCRSCHRKLHSKKINRNYLIKRRYLNELFTVNLYDQRNCGEKSN